MSAAAAVCVIGLQLLCVAVFRGLIYPKYDKLSLKSIVVVPSQIESVLSLE